MPNHRLGYNGPHLFTINNNLLSCKELSKSLPPDSMTRCTSNRHYAFMKDKQPPSSSSNPVPSNPVPSNPVPYGPVSSNPVPSGVDPVPANSVPSGLVSFNPVPLIPQSKESSSNQNSNFQFRYITKEQRQIHDDYIKAFNKNNPNVRDIDILAAEMSQATYISDENILNEYLEGVSSIDKQGWRLDSDPRTQNEYMKTFVNETTGDVAVAYRGTVTWIGEDGRANLANTLNVTKIRQMVKDRYDVDLRTVKASTLQETNEYIQQKYPGRVILTAGHSQGGHDSTQSKKVYFPEAESIVFQPAPGGEVTTSEGRMFSTPNDLVSIKGKWRAAFNPNMDMNIVKSIDQTLLNTLSGGHSLTNQAPLEEIAPSKTSSAVRSASGAVGEFVKGSLPTLGASVLVESLMPNAPDAFKIGAISVGGASGTQILSSMAGTQVAASGLIAPIAGSLVAVKGADVAAEKVLPQNMEHHTRESLKGALDGAAGGLGFVGTQAAQGAIATGLTGAAAKVAEARVASRVAAARAARAAEGVGESVEIEMGETAAAETIETAVAEAAAEAAATTGEVGVELSGLAAFESAAVAATEATGTAAAAEGGLNPIADAAFVAAAGGAAIGGVTGLIVSLFSGQKEQTLSPIISKDELQRVRNEPVMKHGSHMNNYILQDAEFQRLLDEGTLNQINARIEQIIMQRSQHHTTEFGVVNGTDTYLVANADGSWSQEYWNQQRVNENQDAVQDYKVMQMSAQVSARREAEAEADAAKRERIRAAAKAKEETDEIEAANTEAADFYNINPVLAPTTEDPTIIGSS